MVWTRRPTLSSCLLLLLVACSHTPRALNDNLTVQRTREEYLRDHPDGRFNPYIHRGEVVRGMNELEVSASWGIPETRRLSKDGKLEYWTYFNEDDISGNWSRYTLTFEETLLSDWHIVRHFTKNGTLTQSVTPETSAVISNPTLNSSDMGARKR